MTLQLSKDISDDERYAVWTRVVERSYNEQVNQSWSHYMFRLVNAVFANNEMLSSNGGFIFEWLTQNYVDAALMLLRRELDKQDGTENLRNLLLDMKEHAGVLTRARYCAKWGGGTRWDEQLANQSFDKLNPTRVPGRPGEDHIDPHIIQADVRQLNADAGRLREFAERTKAHRTPQRTLDTSDITFRALHKAISDVQRVVEKYYALITLSSPAQWEPIAAFDTIAPFMTPWVVDRNAIEAAAKEGSGE